MQTLYPMLLAALLVPCARAGMPALERDPAAIPVPELSLPHVAEAPAWPYEPPAGTAVQTNWCNTASWTMEAGKAAMAVWTDMQGLCIRIQVSDTDLQAPHQERDANLHEGDAVEFFLQFAPKGTFYMELQAAPNGAWMDKFMLDRFWGNYGTAEMADWDIKGLELAVTPSGTVNDPADVDEGYTVAVRIPYTALKGNPDWPPRGQDWRANVVIMDHGQGSWHWSPSLRAGGFPHDQSRFGWLHTTEH